MTIDTNELRMLAQAALAGPDGISLNWIKLLQDFQQEANPAAVIELLDRLEAAEKDIALKERIIDSLGSELNAVANERDALLARIREMERQEPVAWMNSRNGFICKENKNPEYNVPLKRLAPGAQPAPSIPEISDDLIEVIESRAEQSYRRHHGGIRGQQVTPADALSWHIIHATRDVLATAAQEAKS